MTRIRVPIGASTENGYDVVIETGVLAELPTIAQQSAPAHRYAVISDEVVAAQWGGGVLDAFAEAGVTASLITFPSGESHKTRETWASLTDRMFELGLGRDSAVIALGGGVVGDVAGFVAATYMRGLPVVQVPTTLLAMIDASVGGKTGLDAPAGKNLIGAFHQPRVVVIDPNTLVTLPDDQLRGGMAEAIKHGAIADEAYFSWIADHATTLRTADEALLGPLITGSVRIKSSVVAADPREAGQRAILNFGHTIGHAIERAMGYRLHHGFAVGLGMLAEAGLGERAGLTARGTQARIEHALRQFDLPTRIPQPCSSEDLIAHARFDKKARQGNTRFALISQIGKSARSENGDWTIALADDIVAETLSAMLTSSR